MVSKIIASITLIFSISVSAADWKLTNLVYNDWCPPAALGQRLCLTGGPFDASAYIGNPAEVGSLFVNKIGQDEFGMKFGSRISIPSPTAINHNRKFSYILGEVFRDAMIWDFYKDTNLIDMLGQEVSLEVSANLCDITISGDIAEANYTTQPAARRDVTMTFSNINCN